MTEPLPELLDIAKLARVPGWVYFISHADGDITKIGRTFLPPAGRLEDLRRQSPRPDELVLRAIIPGGSRDEVSLTERTLHSIFSRHRRHGEWFAHTPALEAAIRLVLDLWGAPGSAAAPARWTEWEESETPARDTLSAIADMLRDLQMVSA